MKRLAFLLVMVMCLFVFISPIPASAGTWILPIEARQFEVSTDGAGVGNGTTKVHQFDSDHELTVQFPGTGSPTASVPVNIPTFLSSTTVQCRPYAVHENSAATNTCWKVAIDAQKSGNPNNLDLSHAAGYSTNMTMVPAGDLTLATPASLTNTSLFDLVANGTCASVAVGVCGLVPARLFILRDTSGSCTNNDSGAAFLVKLVCTGTI